MRSRYGGASRATFVNSSTIVCASPAASTGYLGVAASIDGGMSYGTAAAIAVFDPTVAPTLLSIAPRAASLAARPTVRPPHMARRPTHAALAGTLHVTYVGTYLRASPSL